MKPRNYRLLIFRANMLEQWLELQAETDVAAVKEASQHPSDDRLELWRGNKRIAVLRPTKSRHVH